MTKLSAFPSTDLQPSNSASVVKNVFLPALSHHNNPQNRNNSTECLVLLPQGDLKGEQPVRCGSWSAHMIPHCPLGEFASHRGGCDTHRVEGNVTSVPFYQLRAINLKSSSDTHAYLKCSPHAAISGTGRQLSWTPGGVLVAAVFLHPAYLALLMRGIRMNYEETLELSVLGVDTLGTASTSEHLCDCYLRTGQS